MKTKNIKGYKLIGSCKLTPAEQIEILSTLLYKLNLGKNGEVFINTGLCDKIRYLINYKEYLSYNEIHLFLCLI